MAGTGVASKRTSDTSEAPPTKKRKLEGRSSVHSKHDLLKHITVLVGPEEKEFMVHQDILTRQSHFFQSACHGGWKEAKDKIIRLPEADENTFAIYTGWLYTGAIDLSTEANERAAPVYSSEIGGQEYTDIAVQLAHCYIQGDMFGDERYCNAVIDEHIQLAEGTRYLPGRPYLYRVWHILPQNSKMRGLIVDYTATELVQELFLEEAASYPSDFVLEIAKACVRERGQKNEERKPTERGKCFYHEHKSGQGNCE